MTLLAPAGAGGLSLAVRGRHADAGGAAPGGVYVPAYEIYQEGDRLPPIRLARDGRPAPDIWKRLVKNNRLPQVYERDLAAMLAALRWGGRTPWPAFRRGWTLQHWTGPSTGPWPRASAPSAAS